MLLLIVGMHDAALHHFKLPILLSIVSLEVHEDEGSIHSLATSSFWLEILGLKCKVSHAKHMQDF